MSKPDINARTLQEMIAAIHGAIGWIAGTTNEGNHQTAKYTRELLVEAARVLRWLRDGADDEEPPHD